MTDPEHFAPTAWQLINQLRPEGNPMTAKPTTTNQPTHDDPKARDYELEALNALARGDLSDRGAAAAAIHLAEAQVWATLHLARITA